MFITERSSVRGYLIMIDGQITNFLSRHVLGTVVAQLSMPEETLQVFCGARWEQVDNESYVRFVASGRLTEGAAALSASPSPSCSTTKKP